MYFWISGAFLFVMIAGIVGYDIVARNSGPSVLMSILIGIGAAGALVAFIIGIWLSRGRRLSSRIRHVQRSDSYSARSGSGQAHPTE